ncbi:hypothetical protein [Micromonospora sp. NPDC005203]|uniref:hypothetical protein n=1 Tax=Micromonospora sp. NPDC005203 TaxID=3364226 RepID=UPI0036C7E3CF
MDPKPGDVLHIGSGASVQFGGDRSLIFRVIKVCDRPTYDGWVWLTGYSIDRAGNAVERREIFVQRTGLRLITPATAPAAARTLPAPPGHAGRRGATLPAIEPDGQRRAVDRISATGDGRSAGQRSAAGGWAREGVDGAGPAHADGSGRPSLPIR